MKKLIPFVLLGLFIKPVIAQDNEEDIFRLNTITTAVPVLLIGPDSRSGGMGDAGVALSPDCNSIHWNASKLAFAENEFEFSINYTPWLRNLVNDINLAYLSAYYKLDKKQAVGMAMRYFSLGNITFTDQSGNVIRDFKPNEFTVDLAYSLKLSDYFSGGLAVRYINSNLTGGTPAQGVETKPGRSMGVDLSVYYRNDQVKFGKNDGVLAFGANISNIGPKISYSNTADRDFLPCNLKIGTALTLKPDEHNDVTFALDFNKLLVPTPAIYTTSGELFSGMSDDRGVASALFTSFADAPGDTIMNGSGELIGIEKGSKFKEELREINISPAVEWWYAKQFAARFGYFHEHKTKGNRQFFTVGAGLKYSKFTLDVSYLISVNRQNPLAKTLRFTLRFSFDSLKSKSTESSL
jgi:hypothetical protein